LYEGARIAKLTYDGAGSDWKVIRVSRKQSSSGKGETVFLLRTLPLKQIVDIAIRGTENLDDALVDINAKAEMDDILEIPLHSGFRAVARDVYKALRKELPTETWENYSFRLFGHSLGGAAASIVSMYLHHQGHNVQLVVTFGAPRFTTNEGARKYQVLNQNTYRVVRCDDVVPFLPPPNFLGWSTRGYEANGNILLLLAPPYFDYSVGQDIERDFAHQLRTELKNTAKRSDLAFGHRMANYKDILFWFTGSGIQLRSTPVTNEPADISPISYQLTRIIHKKGRHSFNQLIKLVLRQ
jgi:pimeloyl-ACP methyl ester carboxylesterase